MRSERPLHLDVGVPSENAFGKPPDSSGQPDARSEQQLADQGRNLRDLLAQQRDPRSAAGAAAAGAAAAGAAAAGAAAAQAQAPASPFELFQPLPPAPAAPPPPAPAALASALEQMASRLLVADGHHGRRGVQITLADAQLPGVVVDVFEEAGRLVARFTCAHEGSRERLCAGAEWFAAGLAQRLQRDTRVEVQTNDPEDPCLLQVEADR